MTPLKISKLAFWLKIYFLYSERVIHANFLKKECTIYLNICNSDYLFNMQENIIRRDK